MALGQMAALGGALPRQCARTACAAGNRFANYNKNGGDVGELYSVFGVGGFSHPRTPALGFAVTKVFGIQLKTKPAVAY